MLSKNSKNLKTALKTPPEVSNVNLKTQKSTVVNYLTYLLIETLFPT
jgi:hypothetical protein